MLLIVSLNKKKNLPWKWLDSKDPGNQALRASRTELSAPLRSPQPRAGGGGTHGTCSEQSCNSPETDRPSLFENPALLSSGFRVHSQRLTRGELRPKYLLSIPVSSSCSSGGRWGLGPSGLGPQLELNPVQEASLPQGQPGEGASRPCSTGNAADNRPSEAQTSQQVVLSWFHPLPKEALESTDLDLSESPKPGRGWPRKGWVDELTN